MRRRSLSARQLALLNDVTKYRILSTDSINESTARSLIRRGLIVAWRGGYAATREGDRHFQWENRQREPRKV